MLSKNSSNCIEEGMKKLHQDLYHVAETNRSRSITGKPSKYIVIRFCEWVDNSSESYQIFGHSLHLVNVHKDLYVYVDVKLRFH